MLKTLLLFSALVLPSVGFSYPIAGVSPHQRPKGAPSIKQAKKRQVKDLHGVDISNPKLFGWIKDQGNWHNPFFKPGMTGKYDIRGYHSKGQDSGK